MAPILLRATTWFLILVPALAATVQYADAVKRAPEDVLGWVDPLIGSRSGGNVFAGATLPYGMAKGELFQVIGSCLTTLHLHFASVNRAISCDRDDHRVMFSWVRIVFCAR
jgi:hypothetical protein